jgi:hypothetical protein
VPKSARQATSEGEDRERDREATPRQPSAISALVTALRCRRHRVTRQRIRDQPERAPAQECRWAPARLAHSRARGRTSVVANWRTVSTISFCSSLGSKSITGHPAALRLRKGFEIIQEIQAGVNRPRVRVPIRESALACSSQRRRQFVRAP